MLDYLETINKKTKWYYFFYSAWFFEGKHLSFFDLERADFLEVDGVAV